MKTWQTIKKVLMETLLCITVLMTAPAAKALAAESEYTVTEVQAILYTNDETAIFADANLDTVVLPAVEANLPIQVTGITSNGFFQIDLSEQKFYIPGIGLSEAAPDADSAALSTKQIYDIMIAQKAVFPEGMQWTNDNYYGWKGGVYTGGYGCAGFAFAVSDAAFGDARAQKHSDYTNIKVGDILRINHDTHSVIVLEVRENSVIVAEGNYNSSVHWGREISKDKLVDEGSYILTRY
ncbi:MAG: hypothetical protein K2G55_13180 [Lachnospiraceae bacterium]|nr:hypothetical protein [Lachnospiraceae bacterium]MDE7201737.1 hypothetical protein [Lachnospiraceae bacterium]